MLLCKPLLIAERQKQTPSTQKLKNKHKQWSLARTKRPPGLPLSTASLCLPGNGHHLLAKVSTASRCCHLVANQATAAAAAAVSKSSCCHQVEEDEHCSDQGRPVKLSGTERKSEPSWVLPPLGGIQEQHLPDHSPTQLLLLQTAGVDSGVFHLHMFINADTFAACKLIHANNIPGSEPLRHRAVGQADPHPTPPAPRQFYAGYEGGVILALLTPNFPVPGSSPAKEMLFQPPGLQPFLGAVY